MNLPPKQFVIVSIILNLIFLAAFFLVTYSGIFDLWLFDRALPRLCMEKQTDQTVLRYCNDIQNTNAAPTE